MFVFLLLSGFPPYLIWCLVAVAFLFVLLTVVVLPLQLWWISLQEGQSISEINNIAEESKDFVVFFPVALVVCSCKYVTITHFAILDAMILTWILFSLQSVIAGLVAFFIFTNSSIVNKRRNYHRKLANEGLHLRQRAEIEQPKRRLLVPEGLATEMPQPASPAASEPRNEEGQ